MYQQPSGGYQQPGGYQQGGYPQGGYGMPENTSGMGEQSVLPAELQGLNWGAFLLNWIWGLGNGVMIALLALVPFINFFVAIYLLINGNALAWKAKRWESVAAFQATQRKWRTAGLILIGVSFALACLAIVLSIALASVASNSN